MEWDSPIDSGAVPSDGSSFDAIVVGGGPGGASAAAFLAMNGARVLLLEKAVWPRDKTCGDAVGGKSLKHVQELGIKGVIEETPHFRVDGIIFGCWLTDFGFNPFTFDSSDPFGELPHDWSVADAPLSASSKYEFFRQ